MRITDVQVIVTCPGRNFVTVRITTDDGVTGVGDATLNGRELAVASYLQDHLAAQLIGRDPLRIDDIWHYLYRGAYWRRGPVTMTAIAGVDTALWDIKGKVAGLPVYQLLGGRARDGITVYGHASGATIEEAVEDAAGYLSRGYRAVRLQSSIPGLDSTYGIGGVAAAGADAARHRMRIDELRGRHVREHDGVTRAFVVEVLDGVGVPYLGQFGGHHARVVA